MKTSTEQLSELQKMRSDAVTRMETILHRATDEGRTTDAEEGTEYDELEKQVGRFEADIQRFTKLQQFSLSRSVAVSGDSAQAATASRSAVSTGVATYTPSYVETGSIQLQRSNQPQGSALAQLAQCLYLSKGNYMHAERIAESNSRFDPRVLNVLRASVSAGSTASGNWAAGLVGAETSVYAEFLAYLRPQTILGQFGQNGIPALHNVPFRVPFITQTAGGSGYWVGQGSAKPLTSFSYSRSTLEPLLVANIAVLTEQSIRYSNPASDTLIRDGLASALRERMDIDFIDPTKTASAGVSPASITNGATTAASSGATADDVRADMLTLYAPFIAARNSPRTAVLIMSSTRALALSLMRSNLGTREFDGINMNGGTLDGIPVIVSDYVPSATAGDVVVLLNADDIFLGDQGNFAIDVSRDATLEMSTAPTASSTAPTAGSVNMVSMYQTNGVAFRCEREIDWARGRAGSVSYLTGVAWGT